MNDIRTLVFIVLSIAVGLVMAESDESGFTCPVTLPSADKASWYKGRYAHHNEALAVHLSDSGSIVIGQVGAWRQEDGYIHSKYPWAKKIAGKLDISGERLDGESSRPLTIHLYDPNDGVGEFPGGFRFPDPGCWKITGILSGVELSFVIEIIDSQ